MNINTNSSLYGLPRGVRWNLGDSDIGVVTSLGIYDEMSVCVFAGRNGHDDILAGLLPVRTKLRNAPLGATALRMHINQFKEVVVRKIDTNKYWVVCINKDHRLPKEG